MRCYLKDQRSRSRQSDAYLQKHQCRQEGCATADILHQFQGQRPKTSFRLNAMTEIQPYL